MPALGERFRAAREARGLSLSDVSEQIRIRSVYLAAIEDENWSAIGAPVYIRGFLKTYARFLGLDAGEVVASFSEQGSEPQTHDVPDKQGYPLRQAPPAPGEGPLPSRNLSPFLWIAGLVAVALVAFVV
ncbi:MAG: helix-turn-helix domain-containing protein, partial [Vulcanimicrobiaceae bacterium]